jgi:membrane fusion protein (multidrug efflux system)
MSKLALVLLTVQAVLSGCSPAASEPTKQAAPPVSVQVIRPKRGEITRSVTLPGNVLAWQQATLYAKVPGYLRTIAVDKGDRVKQGALLAEIEVPEMEADLAKYKADLEVADMDYQRLSEARKKSPDLVTPQNVDDAKGNWLVAQANLERIETLLKYASLTAPFDGVITRRWVDPGAFIPAATSSSSAQNAAVLMLADFSRVRVQVQVPEPEVPLITNGLPVRISVQELPGRNYQGRVTRYAEALDDAMNMLTEIEIPNPKGELRPGMYASVQLELERRRDALTIPAEALVVEKAKNSVFTVEDGKAKKIAVKVGFNDAVLVEVVEGIKPDEPVILAGKQAINDGQAVNAKEAR